MILLAAVPPLVRDRRKETAGDDSYTVVHATPAHADPGTRPPPVIDLCRRQTAAESAMNGSTTTPWEEELLYSAGSPRASTMIHQAFTYNMNNKEETEQAETQIKNKSNLPGEFYEGRMNDHRIAWLTPTGRENILNGKDRLTGETFVIKECALIRPQRGCTAIMWCI